MPAVLEERTRLALYSVLQDLSKAQICVSENSDYLEQASLSLLPQGFK